MLPVGPQIEDGQNHQYGAENRIKDAKQNSSGYLPVQKIVEEDDEQGEKSGGYGIVLRNKGERKEKSQSKDDNGYRMGWMELIKAVGYSCSGQRTADTVKEPVFGNAVSGLHH